MLELAAVASVNFVVGLLIGWTGVAGFLLPIFFVGYLGLSVIQALALSFFVFAISGVIGSYNYFRRGVLDVRISLVLGGGSLAGALLGVFLGTMIPSGTTKLLLYAVVLLSGVSILMRKDEEREMTAWETDRGLLGKPVFVVAIGVITGAICAVSGAGGPVLVMPLLVSLGMNVRTAIGVSLFDSVLIALPAVLGYAAQIDLGAMAPLFILSGFTHGAGVVLGSRTAHYIRQKPLKRFIAIFSIAIACYMLFGIFVAP